MIKNSFYRAFFTFIISVQCLVSAQENDTFYDRDLDAESSESYILPHSQKDSTKLSIRDLPRNSFYLGGTLSINYSYLIPADRIGFVFGGGISFIPNALFSDEVSFGFIIETSLITPGTKHFFEPGFMAYYTPQYDGYFVPMLRFGYRYQAPSGFLFRIGITLNAEKDLRHILPAISLGYSIPGFK